MAPWAPSLFNIFISLKGGTAGKLAERRLAGQSFLPAEESFLSLHSFDADVGAAAAHDVADMGNKHRCTSMLLSEVQRTRRPRRESPGRLQAELGVEGGGDWRLRL